MSNPDDGGPAFPTTAPRVDQHGHAHMSADSAGMSLRDWFAGQAMAGHLADPACGGPAHTAEQCYSYADAMLEASKREPAK